MAVNSSDRPTTDIVMEGIDIFEDNENAVVMLKAAPGTTGNVSVTVTATDQDGSTFQRVFSVGVQADTTNGLPFLGEVSGVSVPRNTTARIQLNSTDVEGDAVFYTAQAVGEGGHTVSVSAAGLVQVTPAADFVGSVQVRVGVGDTANPPDDTQLVTVSFT
jgi:hypothetical protein